MVELKREKPQYKNLKYKKILSYLSKMDNSKSDIALISNRKILETGTSNLLFVKDKKFFTPKKDYYEGNTYKFFKTKIKNITKKDILLKDIYDYDEILLLGSGKGVTSVRTINEIQWRRKNLEKFKFLSKHYDLVIKNVTLIDFNLMKDPNNPCLFCNVEKTGLTYENDLAYASYDSFPVSKKHCLIIPKRHISDYFDLSKDELIACDELIKIIKNEILNKDKTVKGFNLGTNIGKVSGQSIFHCHFHLIPRREGDVENPQGGVRSVIPSKQHYKREK